MNLLLCCFAFLISCLGVLAIKPLSANPTKWSNTLKQLVGKLPINCLSVFDHFVGLALEGLGTNEMFKVHQKLFSWHFINEIL